MMRFQLAAVGAVMVVLAALTQLDLPTLGGLTWFVVKALLALSVPVGIAVALAKYLSQMQSRPRTGRW